MESPSRVFSPSGTPLNPMSPQRINRIPQQPQSPSISMLDPFIDRTPSSVQGKVAQFNNLSRESTQKRKDNEAKLRRAELGREEAESETRRLKDENKTLRDKLEDTKAREMRVAKKFEVFGEEKRKLIDHQHKCQQISEQEVRRARKEAFKFSSALVTAREDVQKARGHMESLQEQANVERSRGKKYQQEAFDAQLALATVEEEFQGLKRKIQAVEDERDALRKNLGEEQVARIAAEGRLPLPVPADPEDEFASPRKSKIRRISARRESLKENMDPSWRSSNDIFDIMWAAEEGDEFAIAKRNLWVEEKRRQEAEMMITYLKAEYDHKPCTCKKVVSEAQKHVEAGEKSAIAEPSGSAEAAGEPVLHLANESAVEATMVHHDAGDVLEETIDEEAISPSVRSEPPPFVIHEDEHEADKALEKEPESQPLRQASLNPVLPSTSPSTLELEAEKENSIAGLEQSILSIKSEDIESSMSYLATPRQPTQTVTEPIQYQASRRPSPVFTSQTTTISVPLKSGESPVKKQDFPFSPGATMTREQALAAIKQRRVRAKSVHGTTRNPLKADMRNISSKSAPAM